jgi:hypothetical protein
MKKFEILRKLPKCDTETRSERTLLENWRRSDCSTLGCHKPTILKKKNRNICAAQ